MRPYWLRKMKKVNMENCGTLTENFGNFLCRRVNVSDYNGDCAETYANDQECKD